MDRVREQSTANSISYRCRNYPKMFQIEAVLVHEAKRVKTELLGENLGELIQFSARSAREIGDLPEFSR